MTTERVVIASTARTPFTRASKGELKDTRPDTMAAHVIKAALERVPGLAGAEVEDVVLGCAMPEAEQGMNVARIATPARRPARHRAGDDHQPLLRFGCAGDRAGRRRRFWRASTRSASQAAPRR
jgi:hypothetical protein